MVVTVTFSLDEETVRRLGEIASSGQRSEKVRDLINREWERVFQDGERLVTAVPVHLSYPPVPPLAE